MEYTLKEYCDKYLMIDMCGDGADVAVMKYAERYLACCLINPYVFHHVIQIYFLIHECSLPASVLPFISLLLIAFVHQRHHSFCTVATIQTFVPFDSTVDTIISDDNF